MAYSDRNTLKELMEEKFKGLTSLMDAKFENVTEKLDEICGHVQKTNGRVTKLEEYKEYAQQVISTRVTQEMLMKVDCKIDTIQKEINSKLEDIQRDINKKLEDVNFFTRHPKLVLAGIIIIIFFTIATFIDSTHFSFLKHIFDAL